MKSVYFFIIILIFLPLLCFACLIHSLVCLNGCCPEGAPANNFLVDHAILYLSSNRETKFADWVAYKVELNNIKGPHRNRKWQQDQSIPSQFTLSPKDYAHAKNACGYDHGHQAPLGSFTNNPLWRKTNYLSNITPQADNLNQGPWEHLERAERNLAYHYKDIYVVTGPYYQLKAMCPLPHASIPYKIPNGYWKVIAVVKNNTTSWVAFIFSQETAKEDFYCHHLVKLEEVEKLINFKILPEQKNSNDNQELIRIIGC